jgi:predicted RNA binding protein YcfA (HicA-like mRNA interferase family)
MPPWEPINRADLIRGRRSLGFSGPHAGGNHAYIERGNLSVRIPNPHQKDIGAGLLARILRQAIISRAEWESV